MFDKDIIDEALETDVATLNNLQRELIKDNFNTYTNFSYGRSESGNLVLHTTVNGLKQINYYLGFEYISEEQLISKIQVGESICVMYEEGTSRVERLFELLEKK